MKKINTLILLSLIVFGSATSAFALSEDASTECSDGSSVSRSHVDQNEGGNQPAETSNGSVVGQQ
ncbi:MAG: hypothetical protein EP326_10425 [Deltaproteobacteria bacterium]|nr:MAG: hypothetical protein EP326_10425 [Deltaproteobacteria bacterium]TNF31025.1 MAG: hypothetical protein EP319_03445 [Deltaproteobacteria bacterium]